MTNLELQKRANQLYKKYFNKSLNCKVVFNNRLRTSGGRFIYIPHVSKYYIDINPRVINFSKSEPDDTIKHELIHYYLYVNGFPCGHNILFKDLADKLHCNIHMPSNFGNANHVTYHIYQCQSCGSIVLRQRRMNVKGYVCANKVKNNLGMRVSCDGKFASKGTISSTQLQKKNNKVDRLKKNFKHKAKVEHKLYATLNYVLGYKSLFMRHVTQRASIQGKLMDNKLGQVLQHFSKHAQKQFIHALNNEDAYTPKQIINKMNHKHIPEGIVHDYVKKSKTTVANQLRNLSNTFDGLQLDTEGGLGWYLTYIDDDMFLEALNSFISDNYSNGIKLYKIMIKFMRKHNQDYKQIEKDEKQKQQARA